MDKSDEIRLRHMLEAAQEAISFAADKTMPDLAADRMRALAMTRCLEIIGEAAASVSADVRSAYPSIPWSLIIGMRNRLIHAYFDVDLAIVLETVRKDLPPLTGALEKALGDKPAS